MAHYPNRLIFNDLRNILKSDYKIIPAYNDILINVLSEKDQKGKLYCLEAYHMSYLNDGKIVITMFIIDSAAPNVGTHFISGTTYCGNQVSIFDNFNLLSDELCKFIIYNMNVITFGSK